jgi:PAS domain S-box-containing protein
MKATRNLATLTPSDARHIMWLAWLVLAVGLIITVGATLHIKSNAEIFAEKDFTHVCNDIRNKIAARLAAHARIVRRAAAFFDASDNVTRQKWHIFLERQNVEQQLPGVLVTGFAILIPRDQLALHVQEIRREGYPGYRVWPEGNRKLYSSVIFREPFQGGNLRAFGYDMLSEPVRRKAMEQARDMDVPILSGKIVLVHETGDEDLSGALMYVPVFRKGMPAKTVEQRRAAIYGWVYSAYRMNDFMQGIMGDQNLQKDVQLQFKIFDGDILSAQSLLYESDLPGVGNQRPGVRFSKLIPYDFNGSRWTMQFTQTGLQASSVEYQPAWLVLIGGSVISLLLFVLIRSLLNTRAEAQRIAQRLTCDLQQSEEKSVRLAHEQQIILNTMATGILYLKNRKIEWTNPAFEKMFGCEAGEVLGLDTAALYIDSEQYVRLGKEGYKALATGHIHTVDVNMKKKDGSLVWCNFVGQAVNADRPEDGSIWIIQDISERKRTEEELLQSEEKYRLLVETANEGIRIMDVDSKILFANQKLADMLGYSLDELSGILWTDLLFQEDLPDHKKQMALRHQGMSTQYERRLKRKDGSILWTMVSATPVMSNEGHFLRSFGMYSDITERKRMQEDQFRAQKLESVGILAGGIAHDFNNLIMAVQLNLWMAMQSLPSNQAPAKYLKLASDKLDETSDMTSRLITFSRGGLAVMEERDITSVIRETAQDATKNTDVKTSYVFPEGLPAVKIDKKLMEHVFKNLMVNSIEAMPEGGIITVAIDQIEVTGAEGLSLGKGLYLKIILADQGVGIPEEHLSKVFDPYFTTKEMGSQKGQGLGLAVCYSVMKKHAGLITVSSPEGKGAEFVLYLPI